MRIGKRIESLLFDNRTLRRLPIDPITDNHTRIVRNSCFSMVNPTPVDNPRTIAYSQSAMELLDLDISELQRPEFPMYFSGTIPIPGASSAGKLCKFTNPPLDK